MHGAGAEVKAAGDGSVVVAGGQQRDDLVFAGGERPPGVLGSAGHKQGAGGGAGAECAGQGVGAGDVGAQQLEQVTVAVAELAVVAVKGDPEQPTAAGGDGDRELVVDLGVAVELAVNPQAAELPVRAQG